MAIAGTEQVIRQLVENTDNTQFNTAIFCIDGQIKDLGQELIGKGYKIDAAAKRQSGLDLSLISSLRDYINENNIDVLHCHQYTPYIYGLFASFNTQAKVLFTEHGRFFPDSYKWKRYLLNPFLSLFTPNITAISKATAIALAKFENFPSRKIEVVYNGVKFSRSSTPQNEDLKAELGIETNANIVGTIARLDPIKNQIMMITAFSAVLSKHPNSYLVIVGDGPDRQNLEQLTADLKIQDKVIFTGFKVNPQRYFEIIDFFLLSSLSEGTSMTLLEAMAVEKPSVVTNVGGNPEIVQDGITGLVTESQNTEQFANAIEQLMSDKTLSEKMGQAAHKRYSELFSEEKMVNKYQIIYEKLTRNK